MNSNTITRLSATAALLATLTAGAHAQQTTVFATDNGQTQLGAGGRVAGTYAKNFGQGVGFTTNTTDPNTFYGDVNGRGGVSAATAIAINDVFTFLPTAGGNLLAGSQISIGVHGNAYSDAAGFGNLGTVNVVANIFQNIGTTAAPAIGSAVLTDLVIPFTSYANKNDTSDHLNFSAATGTLTGAGLVSGGNYIIAFDPRTTGSASDAQAAVVDTVQTTSGVFTQTTENADSTTTHLGGSQAGQIGFRILATPAPEPGQIATLVLSFAGMGLALVKRRRCA